MPLCSLLLAAMHLPVNCNLETGPHLRQQVQKLLSIAMVMVLRPCLALKPTRGWTCLWHILKNHLRRPAPAQALLLQVSLLQVHLALLAAPAALALLTSLHLSPQPVEAVLRASSTQCSIPMPAKVPGSLALLGLPLQTMGWTAGVCQPS